MCLFYDFVSFVTFSVCLRVSLSVSLFGSMFACVFIVCFLFCFAHSHTGAPSEVSADADASEKRLELCLFCHSSLPLFARALPTSPEPRCLKFVSYEVV